MREPLRMLQTEMKVPSGGNQGLVGTLISVCSTLLLGSQTIHMQIWSPTHITLLIFKLKKKKKKRYSGYIFVTLSWVTNCVGMAAQFVTWETNCVLG